MHKMISQVKTCPHRCHMGPDRIRGSLSPLLAQRMPLLTALEQALVGHLVSPAF
jgi:hypothetical protein